MGWLLIVLVGVVVVVGALAVLGVVMRAPGRAAAAEGARDTGDAGGGGEERGRYVRRAWVMDHPSEVRFFHVLEDALAQMGPGAWRVFVQVPLSRLIEPEKGVTGGERQRLVNKIDRKRVDFVICETRTLRAVAAVELDGSSHDRKDRRERDRFVEGALEGAGVRLIRFDRRGREIGVEEVLGRLGEAVRPRGDLAEGVTPPMARQVALRPGEDGP